MHQRFCGRGLKVVQVLFQDEQAAPATGLFCRQWKERHGLTFPVLKDPLFVTDIYFSDPSAQTPINLLVDQNGVIVYREVGISATNLPSVIDTMLAARGR